MSRSLAAGRITHIESVPTLADGLAGDIDDFALDIGRHALDELALMDEAAIAGAIGFLAREESLIVEGAGAVGVAAVLDGKLKVAFPVVVIVSGRNIDPEKHAAALATPTN
jgi:threonine dehydratase